jgi:hypothetical protein
MSSGIKDYLNAKEAAWYCGVSFSQFRAKAKGLNLIPFKFMGRYLYRRTDLQRAIEKEAKWQLL